MNDLERAATEIRAARLVRDAAVVTREAAEKALEEASEAQTAAEGSLATARTMLALIVEGGMTYDAVIARREEQRIAAIAKGEARARAASEAMDRISQMNVCP